MLRKMDLKKDHPFDVARFVYDADQDLFNFIFGSEMLALSSISKLMRLENNAFSYKYLYVYYEGDVLVGCVSMFDVKAIESDKEWQDIRRVLGLIQRLRLIVVNILIHRITSLKKLEGVYVQTVSITPQWRGKGVGTRMMQAVLDAHCSTSSSDIYLDAAIHKLNVQSFYKKLGFQPLKTIKLPLGHEGVLRMCYNPSCK